MSTLVPRPLPLLLTGALLVATFWGQGRYPELEGPEQRLAELAPLGVAGLGLTLSLWFHRGRVGLVFLLLGVAYAVPWLYRPADGEALARLFSGIALAVPANILLLGCLPERGLGSSAGVVRLALLVGQGALVAWGVVSPSGPVASLLTVGWVYSLPESGGLSLAVLGLYGLAGVVLLGRVLYRRHPLDAGFLAALGATFPALYSGGAAGTTVAFWGLAGVLLALAMVQESYRLAFIDELTGLPGRRALEEQLHSLGGGYAVAMADVDRFKKFNDTHGHEIGDQVLRMVAGHLQRVESPGRAFRYGGEEFTVLFPGKTAEEAVASMEAVRQAVADAGFRIRDRDRSGEGGGSKQRGRGGGQEVKVTVSAGIAERDDERSRAEEVIKAADQALYRAKKRGRNRVAR